MRAQAVALCIVASCAFLAASCQPAIVSIDYGKDEPLYEEGGGSGGGSGSGSGSSSGGGGGDIVGELEIYFEGTPWGYSEEVSCEAWWNLTGEVASTDCEYCDFEVEWAYAVEYTLDQDALVMPSGCESTSLAYYVSGSYYGDSILDNYWTMWGYTADYYGSSTFLLGYNDPYYGSTYFYPVYGADVEVDDEHVSWRFQYESYGYYGYYYDYSSYGYVQGFHGVGRF
jgi:hypothetical protein